MKDGWHKICGAMVYVENGKVMRGVQDGRTVYPYRKNTKIGGWDNVSGLSVAAFRAGMKRGTIDIR